MKRNAPHHPKTLALAAILDVDRCVAVGILEGLFHWAGHFARRGDVGKHADAAIASGIGTAIEAARLVAALIEAGYLDACACHRLRIHDWPEHADQAVHKTSEVRKLGFLPCYSGDPPETLRKSSGGPLEVRHHQPAQGTGHRADGTGQTADGQTADGQTADGQAAAPGLPADESIQYIRQVVRAVSARANLPATWTPSSSDLHLVGKWMDAGIALRVALTGIRECKGTGNTIAYYGPAVQQEHERVRRAMVGA